MHWLACACDLQTGAKVTWRQRQHVKHQVFKHRRLEGNKEHISSSLNRFEL